MIEGARARSPVARPPRGAPHPVHPVQSVPGGRLGDQTGRHPPATAGTDGCRSPGATADR
eukprot:625052-Pyramimonas_sp.AAC.1